MIFGLALFGAVGSLSLDDCYDMLEESGVGGVYRCNATAFEHTASVYPSRQLDACFLLCGVCAVRPLRLGLAAATRAQYCPPAGGGRGSATAASFSFSSLAPAGVGALSAAAVINASAAQGLVYPPNATAPLAHVLAAVSRADVQVLLGSPFLGLDFLHQHADFAAQVRPPVGAAPPTTGRRANVTEALWREYVLPYGFMDETRDLYWRWRPLFHGFFGARAAVAGAATATEAVKAIASLIPGASLSGTTALTTADGSLELDAGEPVSWHSGSAPRYMSVAQIVASGGSCTGTAIVLAAALRAVGIPARLAGCSTEAPQNDDDHHWVEYFDAADAGPFGDYWHTKEGVSKGNAGGPWDAPSGPMNGCLRGVVAGSSLDSMWSSSWSAPTFQPTLWGADEWAVANRWKGGINRCGAYCTAWGCGANQTSHWTQDECAPSSRN